MPTWLEIVLAVLVILVIAFFVAGELWNRRFRRRTDADLLERLAAADSALAQAVADDKGWDRAVLEQAATAAFAERFPGVLPSELHLVLVDDRPGTDEDRAVFEARVAGGLQSVTLLRTGDAWAGEPA
jgi:Na+-transporting methylmalonyl-CoA/oxaloacetate decarboxylase gamma subunit